MKLRMTHFISLFFSVPMAEEDLNITTHFHIVHNIPSKIFKRSSSLLLKLWYGWQKAAHYFVQKTREYAVNFYINSIVSENSD